MKDIQKIKEQNIFIELSYSPIIRDAHTNMKYLIQNSQSILRLTRNKQIIWTSNARTANEIRTIHESFLLIRNLLNFNYRQFQQAISSNIESIITKAEITASFLQNNQITNNANTVGNTISTTNSIKSFIHPLITSSSSSTTTSTISTNPQQIYTTLTNDKESNPKQTNTNTTNTGNNNNNNNNAITGNLNKSFLGSLSARGTTTIHNTTNNITKWNIQSLPPKELINSTTEIHPPITKKIKHK